MKKILYTILIFIIFPTAVFAGDVFLSFEASDTKVGDEILLGVEIDTQNKFYNAIEGTLIVGENIEVKQIITGSSVISAWIENPSKTKTNEISFAGIIAGGFNGNGKIFEIVAVPKDARSAEFLIKDVSIFLNDGAGTEEKITDSQKILQVREKGAYEENYVVLLTDRNPPEPFDVIIVKDINIADGKYVLIFEALDKGTGVKVYEVTEGRRVFRDAQSPHVLENQKLNKKITVKAMDYAGNERIMKVPIDGKICIGVECFNERILLVAVIALLLLTFIVWKKQSKELKRIQERL